MKGLIIVDVQKDFMPGGALEVPEGDQVVPIINRLMPYYAIVVATQDWHPADHGSFASNQEGHEVGETIEFNGLEQMLWPDHCVQKSEGAEFHPDLDLEGVTRVFQKGTDPGYDSYSGFYDNGRVNSTGLHEWLQNKGVDEVHVAGVATDYCVKYTVLDARRLGYKTIVVKDAIRGVEMQPGDVDRALNEMKEAGAEFALSGTLIS